MLHERKRNRLKNYDCSQENLYYITSCIKGRICDFGSVIDKKMILSEYGKIADSQWKWIFNQYPYLKCHAYVIMPDHVHGIIEIKNVGTGRDLSVRDLSLQYPFRKIKSISEIMGAYKTTVSKQIHLAGLKEFQWQRSFYDQIIRNYDSYMRIKDYIINNPAKLESDIF